MASNWFCTLKDRQIGPISSRELLQLVHSGQILPSDHVRKGSQGKWLLAGQVRGLFISGDRSREQPSGHAAMATGKIDFTLDDAADLSQPIQGSAVRRRVTVRPFLPWIVSSVVAVITIATITVLSQPNPERTSHSNSEKLVAVIRREPLDATAPLSRKAGPADLRTEMHNTRAELTQSELHHSQLVLSADAVRLLKIVAAELLSFDVGSDGSLETIKAETANDLARSMVLCGVPDGALSLARTLRTSTSPLADSRYKAVLTSIACAQADAGDPTAASKMLAEIGEQDQIKALGKIAMAWDRAGVPVKARQSVAEAMRIAEEVGSTRPANLEILPIKAMLEDRKFNKEAYSLWAQYRLSDRAFADQVMAAMARHFSEHGTAEEASGYDEVDPNSMLWPGVQYDIAKAFLRERNEMEAVNRLENLRQSSGIDNFNVACLFRIRLCGDIAEFRIINRNRVDDLIEKARSAAELVIGSGRSVVLAELAIMEARAGNCKAANELLRTLDERVNGSNIAHALVAILRCELKHGDSDATSTIHRIMKVVRSIDDKRETGYIMHDLGAMLEQDGNDGQIEFCFAEAAGLDRIWLSLGRIDGFISSHAKSVR